MAPTHQPELLIRRVEVRALYPVRHKVLHPELAPDGVGLPGDDSPGATHLGAYREAGPDPVGALSLMPEAPPWDPDLPGAWRLRGMATTPEARGTGAGARLVEAALAHLDRVGGQTLWCTARLGAVGFYERMGFRRRGEVWDEPVIGPHVAMLRAVARLGPGGSPGREDSI